MVEHGGTKKKQNRAGDMETDRGQKRQFLTRYKKLTEVLLKHPKICGFCYTQLYDVEQEVNGLYTYKREPKFDVDFIRKVNQQKAEIEK